MIDLDQTIPFSTENGNDYLIKFSKFNNLDHIGISIVDISLTAANVDIKLNSLKSLLTIAQIIKDYLINHNVVLYYYCDTKEIIKRNAEISPQEYRSYLFDTLFKRLNSGDFISKKIIIEDKEQGNHYISLITHKDNLIYFKAISDELSSYK